jgi:hypothetical protein
MSFEQQILLALIGASVVTCPTVSFWILAWRGSDWLP